MGRNDCMTLDEAIQEFEFDCKIRHLSPKTIDNYKKQLRYFERFLANELSITSVEDVKPSHIKSFLSKMDDAGRKPQYINDLLKVYKTFFNYLESEGHIESSPAKRIRNMKLPKLKLRTFTEKNISEYKPHIRPLKCISGLLFRRTIRHLLARISSPQRFVSRKIRQN